MTMSTILRHSPSHRAAIRRQALWKGWPPLQLSWEERQNIVKPGEIMSEADKNALLRRVLDGMATMKLLRNRPPGPPTKDGGASTAR